MKKTPLNGIFIALLAILLIGIFWYLNSGDDEFNWYESFDPTSDQPYGTQVIHDLLDDQFPIYAFNQINQSFETDSLNSQKQKGTYVFIGRELYLSENEQNQLIRWVENGNTAFISAKSFPISIMESIYDSACAGSNYSNSYYYYDSIVYANYYHPQLKSNEGTEFHFQYKKEIHRYDFGAFDSIQFCENSPMEPLAYFEPNLVNYVRIKKGKGVFLLHTTPLMFTNYHLIRKEEAIYAAKALSYLKSGDLFWDEYHRNEHNEEGAPKIHGTNETPLSFILSNRSLRWSFYVLLGLGLIYLLFYTRRRQKIIPIIEPKINSSLEFVQSIGRLYFHQRNHQTLMRHQMRYFYSFIRERYRVFSKELNEENCQLLSMRSGVPIEHIRKIMEEENRLKVYVELDDQEIIAFYKLLSQFYTLAK